MINTASFTTLILSGWGWRRFGGQQRIGTQVQLAPIAAILRWPRTLEHFYYSDSCPDLMDFVLLDFQHLLAPWNQTLRSIEIRHISQSQHSAVTIDPSQLMLLAQQSISMSTLIENHQSQSPPIDLRGFVSLESFSAPRIHQYMPPAMAAKYLLAPNLKRIVWNLENDYRQGPHPYETFGPDWDAFELNQDWLQDFIIRVATSQCSSLENIHVEFCPRPDAGKQKFPIDGILALW
ncbi:hypothetical protein BT63DRAFT_80781 [Microthyrium microscopicum]|uniref:Uncharacterized protein n=1 Tax=Microthyrium microscopicum TaxID=703497 RepID=A0A6A6TYP0_9PEZI|nr:hypothetical protein BT63DRAFT_80781 [Microthyrium microscopicum]